MFLAVFRFKRAYQILRRSVVVDWEGTEEGKIAYKPGSNLQYYWTSKPKLLQLHQWL